MPLVLNNLPRGVLATHLVLPFELNKWGGMGPITSVGFSVTQTFRRKVCDKKGLRKGWYVNQAF